MELANVQTKADIFKLRETKFVHLGKVLLQKSSSLSAHY